MKLNYQTKNLRFTILITVIAFMLVIVEAGQPQGLDRNMQPLGSDFRVNDDPGSASQKAPAITLSADGSYIIAWYDERNEKADIFAQRFDANGSRIGTSFQVNDISGAKNPYYPIKPVAGTDLYGNFIITWDDYRMDVFAQRYASSGARQLSNFSANDSLSDHGTASVMGVNDSGDFAIAWVTYPGIYVQFFNREGQRYVNPVKIESNLEPGAVYDAPAIIIDPAGVVTAIWLKTSPNNSSGIFGQRFDRNGASIGPVFQISGQNTGEIYSYAYFNIIAIAADASGNFIVVWRDKRNGNADIYGQRFSADGTAFGENFKVNDDSGVTAQSTPAVAMDLSGNFIVSWMDKRNGDSDIYAQLYDSEGQKVNINYKVTHETNLSSQSMPAVAMNNGKMLFVWQDDRDPATGADIWANSLDYSISTIEQEGSPGSPEMFILEQNYPNPFNPATTIRCQLPRAAHTQLDIYNTSGQLVRHLLDVTRPAGVVITEWDGRDDNHNRLSGGIYYGRLQIDQKTIARTIKIILLR